MSLSPSGVSTPGVEGEGHVLPTEPLRPPVVTVPPKIQNVPRNLVDMPDEVSGAQIHVIYAVPRGNLDRNLDVTDRFTNSIGTINNWLRQQTNNTLEMKLDTYQGRVDITYVPLPRSDAEYEQYAALKLLPIEEDLVALGQIRSDKIYMVYYDGNWSVSCGTAGSTLNGSRISATFLRGLEGQVGVNPCENNPIAQTENDVPSYLDRVFLHEILHQIGIPHVSDNEADIMYGGNPSRYVADQEYVLDFGKDDYGFNRSEGGFARSKPNIYDSPFMQRIVR